MPPCLTLSVIRYWSRVKWSNSGNGVAPAPTPWCSSYRKGSFRVTLKYGYQLYLLLHMYIYIYIYGWMDTVYYRNQPLIANKKYGVLISVAYCRYIIIRNTDNRYSLTLSLYLYIYLSIYLSIQPYWSSPLASFWAGILRLELMNISFLQVGKHRCIYVKKYTEERRLWVRP